ncbi:hypothetical protein SGPA1_31060 [Streptomyces misionensis JCM 4497]
MGRSRGTGRSAGRHGQGQQGCAGQAATAAQTPAVVRDPSDRGELLDVLADPQRRAGAEGQGAAQRGLDLVRGGRARHRRRAIGQPRHELGDLADHRHELLLRHPALRHHHRGAGVAVPVASGPVRGRPAGALRDHGRRAGGLLPVPARAAPADAGRALRGHRDGAPHLGLDGLRGPQAHVQPVRGDAVHAHRLVAVVRADGLRAGVGAVGAGAGAAVPGADPAGDRLHREPLLAGRGGRRAVPVVRVPGGPRLVRRRAVRPAAGGGARTRARAGPALTAPARLSARRRRTAPP